jgi:CheY-like chemotaxis protein
MQQRDHNRMDSRADQPRTAEGKPAVRQLRDRLGVLVVDDEHLVRIMLQLGLERDGFDVWLASNGREAIELYRKEGENIAVVVLDVRMPGLDGPATLDVLRELNPGVRVCFISGDLGDYKPEALLQRGAAYVLTKPFHLNQLAHVLRLLAHGVPAELLPSGAGCYG